MSSSECSCRPQTAALQAKHEAFLRRYWDDDESLLESISKAHPNGATSADLRGRETSRRGKPHTIAGRMSHALDFDRMVKLARLLLLDRSMVDGRSLHGLNGSPVDRLPRDNMLLIKSFAEFRFEAYRNGDCLRCASLIEDAGREGEAGKEGQRILRSLLGVFDRKGVPLPRELRPWSEKSRFEKPPTGNQGSPKRTQLRNRRIIHAVAYLAYLSGRGATRDKDNPPESPCDAVARALQENGEQHFSYDAAKKAWCTTKDENSIALGPAMLKRWLEQDEGLNAEVPDWLSGKSRTGGTRPKLNRDARAPLVGDKCD